MKTNTVLPKHALLLIKVLRAFFNFGWYLNLVLIPIIVIAVGFILHLPLNFLRYLADSWMANTCIADFSANYMVDQSFSFDPLILGLIVYVMASVFKYGAAIEQENKEFV